MKLNWLKLKNFKGLKEFGIELSEGETTIKGENGTGKTTVFDVYLWLLFGKDSTGRSEFGIRPLDDNNQPIKGLVLVAEGEIEHEDTIN